MTTKYLIAFTNPVSVEQEQAYMTGITVRICRK